MKPEEAIRKLKYETVLMEANHKMSTDEYELYYAMKVAMEALEKQIPKKPETKITVLAMTRDGEENVANINKYCPKCGTRILHPRQSNYCDYCGQRFDWEWVY